METKNRRTHCIRCGECCIESSPTLQMEDISLVKDGHIEKTNLYTIRVGEIVWDPMNSKIKINDIELIKIKEKKESRGCIYYDEKAKACRIYDHRPLQCAALACWDTDKIMKVYDGAKAARKEFISDSVLRGILEEHEKRCSYKKLDGYVKRIEPDGEKAINSVIELLKFDYHLRPFISKKRGIDPLEMDFFFGRPLIDTITMFGLKVVREENGSFFLTLLSPDK
ncbi:MAG: YkgJ family cysteine cluster protein [Deltaproteobacteria bacterium]|nr:YkgJ family cysteine cluster protein [Deltaproteobacteria bacterium]